MKSTKSSSQQTPPSKKNGGKGKWKHVTGSTTRMLAVHVTIQLVLLEVAFHTYIHLRHYHALFLADDRSSSAEVTKTFSTKELPIYLLDTATKVTGLTTWGNIAPQWNRTTQYTDFFQNADTVPSLPLIRENGKRPVVLLHCGPKVGSTTLRKACRERLEQTCGISSVGEKAVAPVGYFDEARLYPLIQSCNQTHYFCAKRVNIPLEIPTFDNVAFIHMFPFRNYDDWAASALKQQRDRDGPLGCKKTKQKLKRCEPRVELDFDQYGKTDLSNFKDLAVQRMIDKGESHTFVLYHHRDLDPVLSLLSATYEIPILPGTNWKGKETRPKGTCDASILQKYHDCFSSQLMELT